MNEQSSSFSVNVLEGIEEEHELKLAINDMSMLHDLSA